MSGKASNWQTSKRISLDGKASVSCQVYNLGQKRWYLIGFCSVLGAGLPRVARTMGRRAPDVNVVIHRRAGAAQ